eukprot:c42763_g1_i1 orf=92-310(+)
MLIVLYNPPPPRDPEHLLPPKELPHLRQSSQRSYFQLHLSRREKVESRRFLCNGKAIIQEFPTSQPIFHQAP